MRFRRHIKAESGLQQLDIAPLIDIVFQLLIFFMLTSSFMIQPGIKVDLPSMVTQEALPPQRISLIISSEDVVYLNGKIVTNKEIQDFFAKNKERIESVFIKADKSASLGRVVKIWDICRDAGLKYVNIATTDVRQ